MFELETAHHQKIVMALVAHGPLNMEEICFRADLPRPTANRVLTKLIEEGRVAKKQGNPRFQITDKGVQLDRNLVYRAKLGPLQLNILEWLYIENNKTTVALTALCDSNADEVVLALKFLHSKGLVTVKSQGEPAQSLTPKGARTYLLHQ